MSNRTAPVWALSAHIFADPEGSTTEEALEKSGLNWTVDAESLTTESGLVLPNHVATVRTTPDGEKFTLGVVGKNYQIAQNLDCFRILEDVADVSGAVWDRAGYFKEGRKVFMSMRLPDGLQIAGKDPHDVFLLASTAHDGSAATTLAVTPVRVVCQNTLAMALNSSNKFSIRHTTNANLRINEAREALSISYTYLDDFSLEMNKLLDKEISDMWVEKQVEKFFPIPDGSEGIVRRALDKRASVLSLYKSSPTTEFGRGTAYGFVQTMTEYADWFAPIKGADPTGGKRAERAMSDGNITDKFKARAFQMAVAL